jgi:hypothetical protein
MWHACGMLNIPIFPLMGMLEFVRAAKWDGLSGLMFMYLYAISITIFPHASTYVTLWVEQHSGSWTIVYYGLLVHLCLGFIIYVV